MAMPKPEPLARHLIAEIWRTTEGRLGWWAMLQTVQADWASTKPRSACRPPPDNPGDDQVRRAQSFCRGAREVRGAATPRSGRGPHANDEAIADSALNFQQDESKQAHLVSWFD
jgi:hypothetical protein